MPPSEPMPLVFYVEDDENIRDLTLYALRQAGFEGRGFPAAEAFFAACQEATPDLVLLDIMLPGVDGLGILAQLRADGRLRDVPVIMLTAKGTELDTVSGLDAGADDYLAKPFGMMEMVSRVKAVLRRTAPREEREPLRIGGLELDPGACIVQIDGERVELTLKEFKLLFTFMENIGRVFTREHLLETVWGLDYIGETRTVDVHIGTLRTKLGKYSSLIATVRGIGYRMEDKL